MARTLNEMFRDLIFANECGKNPRVIYKFSDPDGERSGKSGWSFGLSQFDTQNNSTALKCLAECGFTDAEIAGIVAQSVDVRPFAERLAAHSEIIDSYDTEQLTYCLGKALDFDMKFGIPVTNPGGILASADYCNQYGSEGMGAVAFYKALGRPINEQDVLKFKATTKYGKEHYDDCVRRYTNLQVMLSQA